MAKIVVVTSGKGGVGKTTTSAAIGVGLAKAGHRTAIVDFDVGLRNLDLVMGVERRVVYDFVNVINNEATLNQALIRDKRVENLSILAASQTRDKEALTDEGVERVLTELAEDFAYVVCDSPAGIERGALMAMYFADEAIVVTNPEVSSVRDSDRVLGILSSKTRRAANGQPRVREHLLLTRYSPARVRRGEMLSVDDVKDILAIDLLGIIPESEAVLNASNAGVPVILDEGSEAGRAYADAVSRGGTSAPLHEPREEGFLRPAVRELTTMRLLSYFRSQRAKRSASVAKERLQILVARERAARDGPDYLPALQEELLAVIQKYVRIDRDAVQIQLDRDGDCEILELNIVLPDR